MATIPSRCVSTRKTAFVPGSWEVTLFKSLKGLLGRSSGSDGDGPLDPAPPGDVLARAEAGDAEAANEVGLWYSKNHPDSRQVELWFRRAADAGLARAQHNMGVLTMRAGKTAESIQWFRRAVSGGWRNSHFALGSLLQEQGDREGAVAAFEMGAQQECEMSQDALAQLALEEETEESYQVARYWSERSARQGNAEAQVRLGRIFHEGLGVERNPGRAMRWFLQAASQNHAGAQAMIGVAAHLGVGVEADRFHAVRMLMLSAAQGNTMAKAYLPTVFDELTPEERSLLEEWMDRIGRERKAAKKGDA